MRRPVHSALTVSVPGGRWNVSSWFSCLVPQPQPNLPPPPTLTFLTHTQALNVLSSDVPTLVALSAKRMRYAAMPAPSDDDHADASPRGRPAAGGAKLRAEAVSAFISGVLEGKVRTEVLQVRTAMGSTAAAIAVGRLVQRRATPL